jgi:MarR family transcriptional regulator for hemolysin
MPPSKTTASKTPAKSSADGPEGAHKLPTITEAAWRFQRTHPFHERGSRSEQNAVFTGWLNLIARRYRTRLNEHLRGIGQTQARWDALFWISVSEEGATQSELAERIGVEGPTLVRMLNRLEQEGVVERQCAKGDRRAKTIRMKPAAERALAQIAELSGPFRDELLEDVADEELRTCLRVLAKVMARLEREETAPRGRRASPSD